MESYISIENRALIGYRGDEFSVEFNVTQVARTLFISQLEKKPISIEIWDSRKIQFLTRKFHIEFHSKKRYRTHRFAIRAISFFS